MAAKASAEISPTQKLDLGTAAKKAVKGDSSDLIEKIAPNESRIASAKALGYEEYIQPDHVSNDFAFKQLAQLNKSQRTGAGGAARDLEQEGLNKIGADVEKMIKDFGGNDDLGGFSESVKNSMQTNIDNMAAKSEKQYSKLRKAISDKAEVEAPSTLNYLSKKAESLGGIEKLSPFERKVYNALTPESTSEEALGISGLMEKKVKTKKATYGMLDELRKDAGDIMKPSVVADREQGKAKKLYAELTKDQELVAKEYGAEKLWAKAKAHVTTRKAIEDDMKALFGKKFDQSFVQKLIGANTALGKTDGIKMANLMKSIPKEYRREFTASALLQSMGKATENGKLNFKTFPEWYENMSKNEQAKNAFMSNLPDPEGAVKTLDHLANLSAGIHDATKKFTGTGASLQQYYQPAEGLMRGVLGVASEAIPVGLGMMTAGPTGAIVGAIAQGVYKKAKGARTPIEEAVTNLFMSKELKTALIDSVGGNAEEVAKKLSITAPFRRFAKAAGLPQERKALESWITSAMARQSTKEENK